MYIDNNQIKMTGGLAIATNMKFVPSLQNLSLSMSISYSYRK